MAVLIQVRRGTSAEWTASDPVLAEGEIGLDTTLNNIKMGDGTTAWSSLSFLAVSPQSLTDHENDTTNVHGIADTSLLATTSYVDTAESDAITSANSYADGLASNYDAAGSAAAVSSDLTDHENATTSVHGIADTSLLATTSYVDTAESDAVTSANSYSDSLAVNYDPAGSAATAESNAQSYADSTFVPLTDVGSANGVASLDGNAKIPSTQIPAIAIVDTSVVSSEAAMLALTAEQGDIAVRTDLNKTFILSGTDPTLLNDWQELLTPTDAVQSVDGRTGTVSLSDLYDASGSASTAESNANTYADSAVSTHASVTTSIHGISDTSNLVYTDDSRLSDARTPTSHASTHESGGSDEITIAQSQVTDLNTDLASKADLNISLNEQTGTTYTLVLADSGKLVQMNNAAANTLTVPPNSSVAFDVGAKIDVVQTGAGTTTIAAGSGVTINSADSALEIGAQYGAASLVKTDTDTWLLIGNLA